MEPTEKDLRGLLQKPAATLFDRALKKFDAFDAARRSLIWYGEPWKWTVCYQIRDLDEPLAVIIPAPEDLQIAMPMDQQFAEDLLDQKLKKTIHDGLDMVRAPFDTRWGVWSLIAAGIVDELYDVAAMKLERLAVSS